MKRGRVVVGANWGGIATVVLVSVSDAACVSIDL